MGRSSSILSAGHDAAEVLHSGLGAVRHRLKLVSAAAAFTLWVACAVLVLLGFVVWDHWWPGGAPAQAVKGFWIACLLASGGWLVVGLILPAVLRINNLYLARLIEQAYPEFRNSIVAALQVSRRMALPGSIRAALVGRAAHDVTHVDVRQCVTTDRVRRAGRLLAAALVIAGGYALLSPKPILPSLMRAFGSPIPPPTRTVIHELLPEDGAVVLRGEAVRFTARLGGRMPERAHLRFSLDEGRTWIPGQQLALLPNGSRGNGIWEAVMGGQDVQQTLTWQLRAGDAVSELRRLHVRPVPDFADIRVHYEFPAYTGLPPGTQAGGGIDALVGTRATILATANVPVQDAVLILGEPPAEKRQLLEIVPAAPQTLEVELTIEVDDSYRIEFRDTYGKGNREPIRYPIRARVDQPPTVRVERPPTDSEMLANDVLVLQATITDDFGFTRAVLSYRPAGREAAREIPLTLPAWAGGAPLRLADQAPLEELNARPGDLIEWWVSVWDNRRDLHGEPAYQRADSTIHRLIIRQPEEPPQPPEEPSPDDPQSPDAASEDGPPGSEGTGEAGQEGDEPGVSPDAAAGPTDAEAAESFAEARARELETLAKYLEDRADGDGAAGTDPGGEDEAGEGAGIEDEASPGESQDAESEAGSPPSAQDRETGDDQDDPGSRDADAGAEPDGDAGARDEAGPADMQAGPPDGPGDTSEDLPDLEASAPESLSQADDATADKAETPRPQAPGTGEASGDAAQETSESPGEGAASGQPANGASDPEGAGTGGGAESAERPERDPGRDRPPDDFAQPPPPPPAAGSLLTPGRVETLMNELDRALRRGQVDPQMLEELGWTLNDAQQFVQEFERTKMGGQRQMGYTELPEHWIEQELGERDVQALRAEDPSAAGFRGLYSERESDPDTIRELMEAGRQRVTPKYRPLLEAYYRTVASQPAP